MSQKLVAEQADNWHWLKQAVAEKRTVQQIQAAVKPHEQAIAKHASACAAELGSKPYQVLEAIAAHLRSLDD